MSTEPRVAVVSGWPRATLVEPPNGRESWTPGPLASIDRRSHGN
jgi:hypothetical protein